MKQQDTPTLDPRNAVSILRELRSRLPAYVSGWKPRKGGTSWALLHIYARLMRVVIERLNQAPDKNMLAFLDMLGISLIPAQGARAPVVFEVTPNSRDGRAPAGTRLGATPKTPGADPIIFETESAIALASGRLTDVISLWPARDAYAVHSADVAGGRSFTLFRPLKRVLHVLYLAHDTLLALSGKSQIEIEFELLRQTKKPLKIAWEYWDGTLWRSVGAAAAGSSGGSPDGTAGLTRSGVVRLAMACGQAAKTKVNGIKAYWLRGRLSDPLPPQPGSELPLVERVWLRSVIERPLRTGVVGVKETPAGPQQLMGCVSDVQPDQATADGRQIDLSKAFLPLGQAPRPGAAFYFSSEEVFGKPGAEVTVCFRRASTPEAEADEKGEKLEFDVANARDQLIKAAQNAAETVVDAANRVSAVVVPFFPNPIPNLVAQLQTAVTKLSDTSFLDNLAARISNVKDKADSVIVAMAGATLDPAQATVEKIRQTAQEAAQNARSVLVALSDLSPTEAAIGGGASKHLKLAPARLVWEYWDGRRWKALLGPMDDKPTNMVEGSDRDITFVVPQDMSSTKVDGTRARWMRVRLASGSYDYLRWIRWDDPEEDWTNFLPIIESRPPVLESFYLGYIYRSPKQAPAHCLTYNDFQCEDRSQDAAWVGSTFAPFQPVADRTPALYLGFDKPLPTDLISLYLDVPGDQARSAGPPLVWESWDGLAWRELAVKDETANLSRLGMVSFIGQPSALPRRQATIEQASSKTVQATDALSAARFQPGDQVYIKQGKKGELAIVRQVKEDVIQLSTPLENTYSGGQISLADLPRFGTPRSWVRARLKEDGQPPSIKMAGLYLNAVWAVQRQTITDEVLGSSTGQIDQVFFFQQTPVLSGERIEVRELSGRRAEVELPILTEELLKLGLTKNDIRCVSDARTGKVSEVWVRWQARPHLYFSGPDDRHYVVEQARGRLIFGDGVLGKIPPAGPNNVLARRYQSGGGQVGNVSARAIQQLLSLAAPAQAVMNPRPAEGGADGETLSAVRRRGPESLRHRWRAVSALDYEALARQASPGVAVARALPTTNASGRPAPGWVSVVIVPRSQDARPQPSLQLKRQVQRYLSAQAPAGVAGIHVTGPDYLPVGVDVTVAPRDPQQAGPVERRVRAALKRFLHPLTGGPDGLGWSFGRDVYLSDVAALLESVKGVDYVKSIRLLLQDAPQGERVPVPTDRIVVAGSIRIRLSASESRGI
jgi:hypothetical protein